MPAQKNKNRLTPAPETAHQVHPIGGTELARHLMSAQRSRTAVVISYLAGQALRLDAVRLAAQLDGGADVYELCNGKETRNLEHGLPTSLHVFGNGVRIYPHGPQWPARTARPLLLQRTSQLPQLYNKVESEVLSAQQHEQAPSAASALSLVDAVVTGFPFEDLAMVEITPVGTPAMIRGADLLPGIPMDWLLGTNQKLTGTLDPATRLLDISGLLAPRPSPVTVYQHGDVALACVTSVSPAHALIQLWPGSVFADWRRQCFLQRPRFRPGSAHRGRGGGGPGALQQRRRGLVHAGRGRRRARRPGPGTGPRRPSLAGPGQAPCGHPFRQLPRRLPVPSHGPGSADGERQSQPSGVVPGNAGAPLNSTERRTALQSTQRELERARHVIDELMAAAKKQGTTDRVARALQDQLAKDRAAAADVARLLNNVEHQIDALKEDLAKTKSVLVQLRQQRRSSGSSSEKAGQALFLDAAEQFRFDLAQAWAIAVPAVEKGAHPLAGFGIGQVFLDSWAGLAEQQRSKALRAVVDLVADRQGPLRKREPHVLRLNGGARAAPTLRGEDVCMRLYVEQKTPGALRLHYWKLPAGGLELHELVTHDVVKP